MLNYPLMKSFFATFFLFSIFYLLFTVEANAALVCQPIYGGGQTCVQGEGLLVNKLVLNPQTNSLVENLGVNDPRYFPDQLVTFQLIVTNTGGSTLSQVEVKDIFPQFVNFAAGFGTFDSNTKTLTFAAQNLGPSQSQSFTIQGKVVPANQLPADQTVVCVVNRSIATANSQRSEDAAQFCIQKQVLGGVEIPGVTKGGLKVFPPPSMVTTPPTGPEALPLIGIVSSGLFGWILRKKTNR